MADSIQLRAINEIIARLNGTDAAPRPDGLNFSIDRNRSIPVSKLALTRYSIYAIQQHEPVPMGDRRAPSRLTRMVTVEVRILVAGDDTNLDPHMQWVTAVMGRAGRLVTTDAPNGLVLSIAESDSGATFAEGSDGSYFCWHTRWMVEFTTLPADITSTGGIA